MTEPILTRIPFDGSKMVYIERLVHGDILRAEIYEGKIESVRVWLGTLCGATAEEINQIIEWLQAIKYELLKEKDGYNGNRTTRTTSVDPPVYGPH